MSVGRRRRGHPYMFGGGFKGILDTYTGAAAAYSLRKLRKAYTGSAIRVRRTSDNTEMDIGFNGQDLDTWSLLNFVTEDVVKRTTNFTSGIDGILSTAVSATAPITIDGVASALRVTSDTSTAQHFIRLDATNFETGFSYQVSFDYYIPSTFTTGRNVCIRTTNTSDPLYELTERDAWDSMTVEFNNVLATALRFQIRDGVTLSYAGSTNDVFYLKNVVITQLTADGEVVTWYDQSGNSKNITQATATSQPAIVLKDNLVSISGKPSVFFGGTQDLRLAWADGQDYVTGPFSSFAVSRANDVASAGSKTVWSIGGTSSRVITQVYSSSRAIMGKYDSSYVQNEAIAAVSDTLYIHSNTYDGAGTYVFYQNDVLATLNTNPSADLTATTFSMGRGLSGLNHPLTGYVSELLLYKTDQAANQGAIDDAINSFYGAY